MTATEFGQWAFVLIFTAACALGVLAAVIAGSVSGIGAVIEWFDKRKRRAAAYRREETA